MDDPLWIDEHAPDLGDLPQAEVREHLERAAAEPMNLVVYGPPGVGKTAAVRALARRAHADPANDLVEINVTDFFGRTKTEIRNDPRFAHMLSGEVPWVKQLATEEKQTVSKRYKSAWSKAEMLNHVLKESAGYAPSSGGYRTVLLDNAETIREDLQQALRRMMEQYHETTQFVFATRQPTKLIPALRSRCFPVPVRSPTVAETVEVLRGIVEAEDVDYDEDGLTYVAAFYEGNLREAVLGVQTLHEAEGEITTATVPTLRDVGVEDRVREMLDAATDGEFDDARSTLDDLLYDEGLSGEEVLAEILAVAPKVLNDDRALARLHRLAGEVDRDVVTGTSDRLHVSHLLVQLGAEA